MTRPLHKIGFWRNSPREESPLPWPGDTIAPDMDPIEKETVLRHLKAGQKINPWLGYAGCRLCGEQLGTTDMTDGVFTWPEKLEHYVEAHNVRLPAEFVAHVKRGAAYTAWIDEALSAPDKPPSLWERFMGRLRR